MIKKFDIWLANLNPSKGTEVGKTRPVLIIQTDFLNLHHPTTIICPISSNPWSEKTNHILIPRGVGGLDKDSVVLLDQIRAIDNRRFSERLGSLPINYHDTIHSSITKILDLT